MIWHSTLTKEDNEKLEQVQTNSLSYSLEKNTKVTKVARYFWKFTQCQKKERSSIIVVEIDA